MVGCGVFGGIYAVITAKISVLSAWRFCFIVPLTQQWWNYKGKTAQIISVRFFYSQQAYCRPRLHFDPFSAINLQGP